MCSANMDMTSVTLEVQYSSQGTSYADSLIKFRIAGYKYSLTCKERCSDDTFIREAFSSYCKEQDVYERRERLEAFRKGWFDAIPTLTNPTVAPAPIYLTVGQVVERAWLNHHIKISQQYVTAEIRRYVNSNGRIGLKAERRGNQYEILEVDCNLWLSNPRRGTRGAVRTNKLKEK